ncbi:MAG TPA: glucosamine-6-phosphate deaminase [Rhizobiaceae bacterium]|nr:glucosamine-6-phosphate deaminase [Rhizobiaceae bacterium]
MVTSTEIATRPGFTVRPFATREEMAIAAAGDIAACLRELLSTKRQVRMVFASAPSQAEMLAELSRQPGIDWSRVTAFHMDEYIGLRLDHPAAFGGWLSRHFLERVPLGARHLMEPGNDPEASSQRYARLLAEAPIDIVCLGIGVNGHIAFNDPPVADFADPLDVKVVTLDETCRRQQVDEGCFARIDLVPRRAMTMTIPRLLAAGRLFAVVPGALKRDAARRTLEGPIETACPASILRTHENCTLYLDKDSDPNG